MIDVGVPPPAGQPQQSLLESRADDQIAVVSPGRAGKDGASMSGTAAPPSTEIL